MHAFTGYNLGDDIVHVSGDVSYLFPRDGSIVKIERTHYIEKNEYVYITVRTQNGDVFALQIVNPDRTNLTLHKPTESTDPVSDDRDVTDSRLSSYDSRLRSDTNETSKELCVDRPLSARCSIVVTPAAVDNNESQEKLQQGNEDGVESDLAEAREVGEDDEDKESGIPAIPLLPDIADNICEYISLRASFADGMMIVCSNTFEFEPGRQPEEIPVAETSVESSQTATSDQSKVAKPKGKRKEDDSKVQEDADKLKAVAQENEEKLRWRLNDIERLMKAQEGVKNVYVTTPDGLHVTFQHSVVVDFVESEVSLVRSFGVKLENVTWATTGVSDLSEVSRCVVEEGNVVQYMSDSSVRIITPTGSILHSSPLQQQQPEQDGEQSGRQSSLKKYENAVQFEEVEWHIVYANGQQIMRKGDGTETEMKSLLLSQATCHETNDILITREDGVIIVKKTDGTTTVEFMDGTRITTTSNNNGECVYMMEHECMATVVVDEQEESISLIYGNGRVVKGYKNGGYTVGTDTTIDFVLDKNGNSSIHPRQPVLTSTDNSIQVPSEGQEKNCCLLQQSDVNQCLYLADSLGNRFSVNLLGEYNIVKKNTSKPCLLPPRYFVVHADGKGDELLRWEDVDKYISGADEDDKCAVIRTSVEGDEEAQAITVISPRVAPSSKVWSKPKSVRDIIPVGLRERDFKLFPPVEQKTEGARLGTRISVPCVQQLEPVVCPEVLELRHITKFDELKTDIREQMYKVMSDFGEFIETDQYMKHKLHNKDMRSAEEKDKATDVQERYMKQKGLSESVIVEKYLEEITPPPPPPVPHARTQPERPPIEWKKDEEELEELMHAKAVIGNRQYPKYFDTEEGRKFLELQPPVTPDMKKLTEDLAMETRSPPRAHTPPSSTPPASMVPDATSTPHHMDDSSMMSMQSSTMSVQYNTR